MKNPGKKICWTGPLRLLFTTTLLLLFCFQIPAYSDSQPTAGEGFVTSFDGVRLFYKVVGQGPDPLVVVHGGPGNTMFSILPDLEPLKKGRSLIYYDQRGCGRSDPLEDSKKLAIENHVKDLEAIRLHFKLEKLTLLGNSWGGLLASFYAITYPKRVARLILHSPASPSYDMLKTSTPFILQRIPKDRRSRFDALSLPSTWLTYPDPLSLCREFYTILTPVYFSDTSKAKNMHGDVCAGPPQAVRRQLKINKIIWHSLGEWNLIEDLKNVTAPTLIIHGSYDMIPLESSIAWAKAMPNARLLVIQDSGHMTHIEQPVTFFTTVEQFLHGKWPDDAISFSRTGNDDDRQAEIEIYRP